MSSKLSRGVISYHSQFWSKYSILSLKNIEAMHFFIPNHISPISHLFLPNPYHPDYARFWRVLPPRPISETLLPISVSPSSPLWTKWNRWERVWEKAQSKNQWRYQQSPLLTIAWDGKAVEYMVEWLDSEWPNGQESMARFRCCLCIGRPSDVIGGVGVLESGRRFDCKSRTQSSKPPLGMEWKFLHQCCTELRNSWWCLRLRGLRQTKLLECLHNDTNIRANIWESKRGAPIKSNVIVEPFTDVCLPMSLKLLHPESYCIWVSFPGTSTVALSRITLAVGIYSMRSSRKGVSVEPDAVTVRLVGAVVDIFCKAQSSQLFRLIPGVMEELMANPLIKQLQDGVDAWMSGKLPITDILEPGVKRELNNSSRLWHEILTYPWNWRRNSQMPLTHGGYCWRVPRRLYQKN